jgi:molybdenum cofactor biosynthesis protein MoaC
MPTVADSASQLHDQTPEIHDSAQKPQVIGSHLGQHDRALLLAIYEHGMANSALPEEFEKLRERHNMTGPEYAEYWRLTAGALLLVPQCKDQARSELRVIEGKITGETAMEAMRVRHKRFMKEFGPADQAFWRRNRQIIDTTSIASDSHDQNTGGAELELRQRNDESPNNMGTDTKDVNQVVGELPTSIDKHAAIESQLDHVRAEIKQLGQRLNQRLQAGKASKGVARETTAQKPGLTKRAQWRENKRQKKLQEELDTLQELRIKHRAVLQEVQLLKAVEKQRKVDRSKSLKQLEKQRLDLLTKQRDLMQRMEAVEESSIMAQRQREEANSQARKAKEDSIELGDILDDAIEKVKAEYGFEDITPEREDARTILQSGPGETIFVEDRCGLGSTDVDYTEAQSHLAAAEPPMVQQSQQEEQNTAKRQAIAVEQPEEEIDEDEWDVGGMGFLRADDAAAEGDTSVPSVKSIPLTTPTTKPPGSTYRQLTLRLYSTSSRPPVDHTLVPESDQSKAPSSASATPTSTTSSPTPHLPHLTSSGSAHMVSVSAKAHTVRTAIAVGTVYFSNPTPLSLIKSNTLKKGDVLSVSRIAGIMAAKKCPDLVPLCHPIALTSVGVELRVFSSASESTYTTTHSISSTGVNDLGHGGIEIEARVSCTGPTGVEMEALTSVMGTALSVVDMCKAVDKFQRIQDVRVVLKEGGKSGVWREEGWRSWQEE